MTQDEQNILESLAEHYLITGVHADFQARFGDRFTYSVPSRKAGYTHVNTKGPDPRDYVTYAYAALRRGDESGWIDAVGHAERAVHLSVESLVSLHCLNRYARKVNFPGLLRLFEELRAFPTRLMAALNRRRNLIEHEYEVPTETEAREFVEMAELFVLLCYRFFRGAVIGVYVGEDAVCREYRILPEHYAIGVFDVTSPRSLTTPNGVIHYNMALDTPRHETRRIPIDGDHFGDWSLIVALLAFTTNSSAYRLHQGGAPGEILSFPCAFELADEQDEHGRHVVKMTESIYGSVPQK